jgi:parallel beta-helix repeat protein
VRHLAAVSVFWLAAACGGSAAAPGPGDGAAGAAGTGGAAGGTDPDAAVADETLCGQVQLAASRTVAAGSTLTICAGSTVTAGDGVGLTVEGRLLLQGVAGSPVRFAGSSTGPASWDGIVVAKGGTLSATYVEIRDAGTALTTRTGASFDIDQLVIERSRTLLTLASGGRLSHGTLHGTGPAQVTVPIVIDNASPRIEDTLVDQALWNGVDFIIVVGAGSAPVFDHLDVADAHCGFHLYQGSGVTITNSHIHHSAYGIMLGDATGGQISRNNFVDDGVNIGSCVSGTAAVTDNYFVGPAFDASCSQLSATGAMPASPYADVGPRP